MLIGKKKNYPSWNAKAKLLLNEGSSTYQFMICDKSSADLFPTPLIIHKSGFGQVDGYSYSMYLGFVSRLLTNEKILKLKGTRLIP